MKNILNIRTHKRGDFRTSSIVTDFTLANVISLLAKLSSSLFCWNKYSVSRAVNHHKQAMITTVTGTMTVQPEYCNELITELVYRNRINGRIIIRTSFVKQNITKQSSKDNRTKPTWHTQNWLLMDPNKNNLTNKNLLSTCLKEWSSCCP